MISRRKVCRERIRCMRSLLIFQILQSNWRICWGWRRLIVVDSLSIYKANSPKKNPQTSISFPELLSTNLRYSSLTITPQLTQYFLKLVSSRNTSTLMAIATSIMRISKYSWSVIKRWNMQNLKFRNQYAPTEPISRDMHCSPQKSLMKQKLRKSYTTWGKYCVKET